MAEIREIPGFPGYGASADGRIWREKRVRKNETGSAKGYWTVSLTVGNKRTHSTASRLVWMAFNGELSKEIEVDHIDFDRSNNSLSNLQALSQSENYMRSVTAGRMRGAERHPLSKISNAQAAEIRAAYKKGVRGAGYKALAKKHGVASRTIVYTILYRKEL